MAGATVSSPLNARLRAEADLLETFTRTYGRKFSELIDRLNAPQPQPADHTVTDLQCVRLCVEAVNMIIASQAEVAKTLKEIAGPDLHTRPALREAA